jgi:DHA2 family methylenomycin A resistance protein-like MFS transporter
LPPVCRLGNLLSGKLHGRFNATQIISNGLGFAAIAVPLIAASLEMRAPWVLTYAAMIVFGCGTALSVAPMISTVLEQVPGELAGVAAGLLSALRQAGSLFGVAIAGAATILAPQVSNVVDRWRGLCDVRVGRVDVGFRAEMARG